MAAIMTPCNIRIGGLHDIGRHLLSGINIRVGNKSCYECEYHTPRSDGWVTCSPVREVI